MSIESVYANRFMCSNNSGGHGKNYKAPKLKATEFEVGDIVVMRGKDGIDYLKGKIISLVQDMHIEGTILAYSDYIRYPEGTKDVFVMERDGKRNLNGMDFVVFKIESNEK